MVEIIKGSIDGPDIEDPIVQETAKEKLLARGSFKKSPESFAVLGHAFPQTVNPGSGRFLIDLRFRKQAPTEEYPNCDQHREEPVHIVVSLYKTPMINPEPAQKGEKKGERSLVH